MWICASAFLPLTTNWVNIYSSKVSLSIRKKTLVYILQVICLLIHMCYVQINWFIAMMLISRGYKKLYLGWFTNNGNTRCTWCLCQKIYVHDIIWSNFCRKLIFYIGALLHTYTLSLPVCLCVYNILILLWSSSLFFI